MRACDDKHRLLARLVDEAGADPLAAPERAGLQVHLAQCAGCRAAIDDQRIVAEILRNRPPLTPSPAFAVRLAARLDEVSGWLGLLDWRAWTFRLAPVALALAVAAFFAGTTPASDTATPTLDTWTRGVAESTSVASAVWQDRTSSDALLETILIGPGSSARDTSDVR